MDKYLFVEVRTDNGLVGPGEALGDSTSQRPARSRDSKTTAVGHLTPFLDTQREVPYFQTHARKNSDAVETAKRCPEVAGPDMDLCIEIHRQMNPYEAVQLGRAIEPYFPIFMGDPVLPDNLDEIAYVAQKLLIPIATGERTASHWEYEMLLKHNAVQLVLPDVCIVSGIFRGAEGRDPGRGLSCRRRTAQSAECDISPRTGNRAGPRTAAQLPRSRIVFARRNPSIACIVFSLGFTAGSCGGLNRGRCQPPHALAEESQRPAASRASAVWRAACTANGSGRFRTGAELHELAELLASSGRARRLDVD